MRKADGSLAANSSFAFADVPQGGGGYVTGCDIHSSGRMAVGTDTCGCYLRDPGDAKWTPVFTTATMSSADYNSPGYNIYNCSRVRFAPSNKNRFYSALMGYWFKVVIDPAKKLTDPGAITCTRFNLPAKWIQSGGGKNRFWMTNPAVHPTDPDTVLVPTSNGGCYYTTNGGSTVSTITIPANTDPPSGLETLEPAAMQYLVWIDQGNASYCYIFVQGTGLYRSTTGVSGTFSLVTGSPTVGPVGASSLYGEADGTLWITGDSRYSNSTGLWRIARAGTTFTKSTTMTTDVWRVQVDPFDSQRILVYAEAGGYLTTNRDTSWALCAATGGFVAGGECKWREGSSIQMGGGFHFDPSVQNRILWCNGFGVGVSTTLPASFSVTDYSKGIEGKLDVGFTVHPTTGKIIKFSWDLPNTIISSLTSYTNIPNAGPIDPAYAPGVYVDQTEMRYRFQGVQIGGQVDWAIDDPTFWVQSEGYGANDCYSTQGGLANTWVKFAGDRSTTTNAHGKSGQGAAGSIAVSNKNDIVIAPSNDAYSSQSSDGGATWSAISLGGSIDYSTSHAYFTPRITLAADKTKPGWFSMLVGTAYPNTSDFSDPAGGLWVRPGSGQAWVQVITGDLNYTGEAGVDNRQYYSCKLAHVPGYSGELLYTTHQDYTNDPFWYIVTDGTALGTTKTQPNTLVRNVTQFDFGKLPPGMTGRPAVYFYGDYNGVRGMWVTFDWFTTFLQISNAYPGGYITGGAGACVAADMTTFGRAFCGLTGRGSVFSTYQDVAHAT